MPISDGDADENTYIESQATDIYTLCSALFGQPVDPETPYRIFRRTSYSVCSYNWFTRSYDLVISNDEHAREQLCASLSEIMYERVVDKKPGTHQQPWLYSMLGYTSAQCILGKKGFQEYADYRDELRLAETDQLFVDVLRPTNAYMRIRNWIRGRGRRSVVFAEQAQRLAIELTGIVGTDAVAKIVGAPSFEFWLRKLPHDQQQQVEKLVNMK